MDSPEDVTWADSCLSKDHDMIDTGWNSLRDALFEALNEQLDPSPNKTVDSSEKADMDIVHIENNTDRVEKKTVDFVGSGDVSGLNVSLETLGSQFQSSDYDTDITKLLKQDVFGEMLSPVSNAATSNGAEPKDDGSEDVDAFFSKHKMEDIFLPTYNESLRDLRSTDPEVDFVFQEFKLEQSTEDIFKVWDFDSPPEENDLIKQLKKALTENPLDPAHPFSEAHPFSDDYEAWKVSQDRSVDDLISGIADLTLSPISGQNTSS